jgi:hypothetical protein
MSTCRFEGGWSISGSSFRHHATRLRKPRPPHSSCVRPPRSQETNDSSSRSRRVRPLAMTAPASHSGHFQRCAPDDVLPFFFIRPPHNGQRFAFLDRVLTRSSSTRQAPYFS